MYNLLIVDDEPLVQVGIKSMLNWRDYGIEVIGTAANEKQALEFMKNKMPDIVITDIKMPSMSGLDLVKYCHDNFSNVPKFIILTSFKEFELVKQAIKYNVNDYLLKIEDDKMNIEKFSEFDVNSLKKDLNKAFEEYDVTAVYEIFTKVINDLKKYPYHYLYALDCAGNMLYLSINLLADSREVISEIFKSEKHGYRSLYEKKSVNEIITWLQILRDHLCKYIEAKKKNYKHHIVTQVKKYINENIEERLYLNEIADLHNISPSYLSSIFKKDCRIGFSEYITNVKIDKAKELLLEKNHKVYEVSNMLGYESAFYFSKVFKKVTGYSPKEYIQRNG